MKWIDFNGYLRKSWAYAVSSVDSKVKSNFRMWHSLISPQPNKFAEVIMPRPIFEDKSEDMDRLMRGITFIIENEGWQIIECDWTSVEGIAYMSLTESKVNYQYDDRDIAKWFPRCPTGWFVCQTSRTFDFKDAEPILVQIARLNLNPPTNQELDEILETKRTIKMMVS